uniref:3-deoxy-8-phosphooctulonate synthase n=1 Tax=uncultured Flavobacteriia bacterium TaxID=212695 RepID=H6RH83_9BACT|nr:2-Keto-3-deoxy-D-manno-octulosonate-8-phosphate synthase [uncultured bacterium]CCG00394.1 2-dehydro-3-deoxyphosphooctonate aldolase [uncultured Flavobacteriia bacterium]CCG00434.1 3-deoxy-8-phosphooctulonate synthase [uncultured Flavobacteriia bacterium]
MITDKISKDKFLLIAGPCAIEGEDITIKIAKQLISITSKLSIPLVFKGSYRKANRTRLDSFTGIGDLKALKILKKINTEFNIPVITDIHGKDEAELAAEYVDILQIPAFLARQTDLLVSAAKTGKTVNIKKGQFMSAESMKHAVDKVKQSGNNNIMLTERGTQFGYNDLIVDYRGISELKKLAPTILDVTHSVQKPNQSSGITSGSPEHIESLAKAGIVNSVDGIFLETHTNPSEAKSDGSNMLDIKNLEKLLSNLLKLREVSSKL